MKILEIKNNLVKISYDVNDNLALSGFAVIEDKNCPYVAQIVNLKADGGSNYAILKLLFTFDEAGILKSYNGTIPSENAEITLLPTKEILELFRSDSPIFLGTTAQMGDHFNVDLDVFMSGLLICSNSLINTGKLLTNVFPQIVKRNKKVILLDATGDYYTENSFVFGKHFKLPLNCDFLDYIFDNDLEGVEPVSKAVVQDIFSEVKEYIRSIPQGYLPIDLLINVVQEQYAETKIPELVLLKNKLIRYKESNVFASGNDDVFILRSKVAHTDSLILDVSQVDFKLIRKLIEFVYDTVATIDSDICVFVTMNNDFADKKLLRKTMEYGNIHTTIICAHEFKYLPDLKQIIPNMILFVPQTVQHDFAGYNTFLSKLNPEEFIVYGEYTQKIPFIVQLSQYDENMFSRTEEISETEDEQTEFDDAFNEEQAEISESSPELQDEDVSLMTEENTEDDNMLSVAEDETLTGEQFVSDELNEEENASVQISNDDNVANISDIAFDGDELNFENNSEVVNSDNDFSSQVSDEVVSEDNSFENDILSDREILEEQVASDVDASFYKKDNEEDIDDSDKVSADVLISNDEITDEDLDYIEALSQSEIDNKDIQEDENIEIVDSAQPEEDVHTEEPVDKSYNIPIYTPDEFKPESVVEEEAVPTFKTGDVITHPKYGQGVVEKMINYGNKTLCSINFVNLGRRLLDPSISDIQLLGRDGATV